MLTLLPLFLWGQENYNYCASALEICPNFSYNVTNLNANKTLCGPCEDNFSFCFTPNNTIWLKFTSNNTGGNVIISLSNANFELAADKGTEYQASLIRALAPCDGTTYSAVGNCINNGFADAQISASLSANTTYYLVLNGAKNNNANLPAEFSIDVEINGISVDRPIPQITIQHDTLLCKNEKTTLLATINNCPDQGYYSWFINGELKAKTIDPSWETNLISNQDIVTVSTSCYTQCVVNPEANSSPIDVVQFIVDAGEDVTINEGEQVQLDGLVSVDSFYWSPNYKISSIYNINPVVSPTESMTYSLTGVDSVCSITDVVNIIVIPNLTITNTFTPNEDGVNDKWEIPSLAKYPNAFVQIYSRGGQLVFSTTGYSLAKAWDGTFKGKNLPESTYYYVIELRDEENKKVEGFVNLVR